MVQLAAFPKCFMDQLCVEHSMTIFEWIEMASTLDVDGLEFYSGFVEGLDAATLKKIKAMAQTLLLWETTGLIFQSLAFPSNAAMASQRSPNTCAT